MHVMDRHDPLQIANILISCPVWARLGLAAPDERCRERAAETIGMILADRLAGQEAPGDDRQMSLPIL
jgi:hypothetical protein